MANDNNVINNAAMFAGEALLPGGSNLLKGDIKTGAIHTVLGFAARAAFGFPGLLLVSANSFSRATTGRNLTENLAGDSTEDEE